MNRNIWLDGVMGVIVGDALGCPVQFMEREEIRKRGPVTGMEGHGTYDMPHVCMHMHGNQKIGKRSVSCTRFLA